jgi:hypothetical protein
MCIKIIVNELHTLLLSREGEICLFVNVYNCPVLIYKY